MVGLLVACLYVVYDTQLIIERAERGDKDVPIHTMILFMDLVDIFIRVIQLLLELKKNSEEKEKRRRRD